MKMSNRKVVLFLFLPHEEVTRAGESSGQETALSGKTLYLHFCSPLWSKFYECFCFFLQTILRSAWLCSIGKDKNPAGSA